MSRALSFCIVFLLTLCTAHSNAQERSENLPESQPVKVTLLEDSQKTYLKREAQKELKIGLQLYQELDDYRAISALKRYRILDATLKSQYLSNLVIGQIYQRNNEAELSAFAYENALKAAPDLYSKTFSYLLANQQSCVALSFYFDCADRLEGLKSEKLTDATRDLVDYQSLFVDVVLRRDINAKRASLIQSPLLKTKAASLLLRNKAFEDLSLKSPLLSGTLSALIPGAGQLYNGRYWDALLSLSFNAAFAGATYYSYKELDDIPLTILSGVVFLGFYIGNITNAVTDAQRINANTYLEFFEHLKRSHWARVHFQIDEERVSFGYRFDWPGPQNHTAP